MKRLKIITNGSPAKYYRFEETAVPAEILKKLSLEPKYPVYCARLNNRDIRLNDTVAEGGKLEFIDMTSASGNMVYQVSLIFLYLKAVHDVLGKKTEVTIANSLSKGLYTVIHTSGIDSRTVAAVEKRMRQLQKADIPIIQKDTARKEALLTADRDEAQLLKSAPDLERVNVCLLDDERSIFFQNLVPSTGYLEYFELRKYHNGVLLRYPYPSDPCTIIPFEPQELLYEAFSEEQKWEKLMGVSYAGDLNRKTEDGSYRDLIMLSEALHEKKTAEIARMIKDSGKRIILIAGPSSSGKTTFARRLCIQLRVAGLHPLYLGTDDYFINREDMIPDENGNLDFEGLSAVDIGLFTEQMNQLLAGKTVDIPRFDFITGKKVYGDRITSISSRQPIVIEGIHALNPLLTTGIEEDQKFRIYISPLTQLNIDRHHRVPTTDARMLRRLVRDYRTRGKSAETTILSWPSVRAGEDVNIFPFNTEADVFFNSHCLYELAVLKKYAEPLLKSIRPKSAAYPEAGRMLRFLEAFRVIEDDSCIVNNSILREFIGGSIFD